MFFILLWLWLPPPLIEMPACRSILFARVLRGCQPQLLGLSHLHRSALGAVWAKQLIQKAGASQRPG